MLSSEEHSLIFSYIKIASKQTSKQTIKQANKKECKHTYIKIKERQREIEREFT
jgi:hypothetical protein